MRRLIFLLVLFLSACSVTQPVLRTATDEMTPGYDLIGLPKYCDTYLKAPTLPALSTLSYSFGNPLPCIQKKLNQNNGLRKVQIDLMNTTCCRNRTCTGNEFCPNDWNKFIKAIKTRAKKVYNVAKNWPEVEWWLSFALEHDITDPNKVREGIKAAGDACPVCKLINSPFTGATPPPYPVEKHGTKVRSFSVSADGASTFDGDNIKNDGNNFQHRISGTDQTYAWWNECNGRCTGEENFTPINKRTAWPELWQFRMANLIMLTPEPEIPPAPAQCKTVRKVQAKEIIKPTAERYCNGQPNEKDPRGNRPLLILQRSCTPGHTLGVFNSAGKRVGCFRCYGKFDEPGYYRYYMGDCSGQNPYELYRQAGNEWVFTDLGKGQCLLTNSIRRMGVYR